MALSVRCLSDAEERKISRSGVGHGAKGIAPVLIAGVGASGLATASLFLRGARSRNAVLARRAMGTSRLDHHRGRQQGGCPFPSLAHEVIQMRQSSTPPRIQCVIRVLTTMSIAVLFLVHATPGATQDSGLAKCLAIAEINARVACYDAIARAERQTNGRNLEPLSSSEGQGSEPVPAAPISNPRAEFGLGADEREHLRPVQQQQLARIGAHVVSARMVGAGYWQISLDDGSIWQLTEVSRAFRPPHRGDAAVIRRAALGSYLLDLNGQPLIRIKRLR